MPDLEQCHLPGSLTLVLYFPPIPTTTEYIFFKTHDLNIENQVTESKDNR